MALPGSFIVAAASFVAPLATSAGYVIEPPDVVRIDVSGLPDGWQAVNGEYTVRPDGSVYLGRYGSVTVTGRTPSQAQAAIVEHLSARVQEGQRAGLTSRVEVTEFNSKYYYVFTEGGGAPEQVVKFPLRNGGETVLDAVTRAGGSPVVSVRDVRVERRNPTSGAATEVLSVDWVGIVRRGDGSTNHRLLPGDRLYVKASGK